MDKNNNIIEFLIECMVLSKLSKHKHNNSQLMPYNKNGLKLANVSNLNLSKRLLYYKLENIFDIDNIESEYNNYKYIN